MLTIEYIGDFNPFEWDDLRCPICMGNKYTSLSHSSIYCDECNAKFTVRNTAGDPGCVIDCYLSRVHLRNYDCPKCEISGIGINTYKLGDTEPRCITCGTPLKENSRYKYTEYKNIQYDKKKFPCGPPISYYLVLKIGDYCSGWLPGAVLDETKENFVYVTRNYHNTFKLPYPTQKQWDEYLTNTLYKKWSETK